ncbi:type II toxin-antitoxin system Phd/YefM family antitoxin [Billgrantia sp. LNSP4103-1]|uniref:type II toxin-antitoxin system Phd/YefM family antitoxin n=1 Tax=Billgrantia sp. LNSP4103-1 TaxID=3410266 RepID=UPI00403F05EB
MKIAIEEAQLRLDELIERAHQGEQILISGGDGALVEMLPVNMPESRQRKTDTLRGALRGEIQYEDGWDEPMTDDEVSCFLGLGAGKRDAQR